jgi:iron complex outermembrane receptor protein
MDIDQRQASFRAVTDLRRYSLAAFVLCVQVIAMAQAAPVDLTDRLVFNIPAQPLQTALVQFSKQTHIQVTAASVDLGSLGSDEVIGTYSIEEALRLSLLRSGLSFRKAGHSAISIGHFSEAEPSSRNAGAGPSQRSSRNQHPLGEVTVTAQKRLEPLQDVPVSDTVITWAQLHQLQMDNGSEIARQTPNLRVSLLGNESQPKFALRGISTPEFNLNAVSPTGVFYDEMYVAAPFLGGPPMFDIDRVEVLRGPQGTLFGKNTTGGAINFISRTPTHETHTDLSTEFGDYGYYRVDAVAETPLVADSLALRVALDAARSAGFITNVNPQGHNLSNIDRKAGRVSLAYRNSAGLEGLLRIFATDSSPKAIGAVNEGIFADGLNAAGVNPRINPYSGKALSSTQGAYDRSGDIKVHAVGTNLTVNKSFGRWVLTSITGCLSGHFTNLVDADGTFQDLLHADFYSNTREISQDARLASTGAGPFQLIAGLYYFQDRVRVDTRYHLFEESTVLDQHYTQRRRSFAEYVDGTYDLTPTLTAYAGIRWTDDRGEIRNYHVTPTIPEPLAATYHDGAPTGRAGVRWKMGRDMMTYAQYARGYRSSAINGGALTSPGDFNVAKPEYLDSYELGLKSRWLDRRFTVNASAFFYYFRNQQFINVVGIDNQQLENAGRSQIVGVEVESVGRVTEALEFSLGLGLLHSTYKSLTLNGANLAGNELIEAPRHTLNLDVDYTIRLPRGGTLILHADAVNVGSQFYSAYNNIPPYNLLKTPSFWEANARITWRDASSRFEVALWGKNLFGNEVATGMQIDPTTGTLFTTVPYPARYGVGLGVRL